MTEGFTREAPGKEFFKKVPGSTTGVGALTKTSISSSIASVTSPKRERD